jgi:hypothetical protein
MELSQFEAIRRAHGGYASWAVWAAPSTGAKSNIGELSVLDPAVNPLLLTEIKTDVVMVGLNISRTFVEPFRNFHDQSRHAQDYKLRFGFSNTPYYGAYMTDVIKNTPQVDSALLMRHLSQHLALVADNFALFLQELNDLGASNPLILAFGRDAHGLLARHLPRRAYSRLVKVTHYSHRIAKEAYRSLVRDEVARASAEGLIDS